MTSAIIPVEMKGGLDTTTPKFSSKLAGSIKDSLNFEVGIVPGYTKMEGYERYDGTEGIYFEALTKICAVGATIGDFSVGETVLYSVPATITRGEATVAAWDGVNECIYLIKLTPGLEPAVGDDHAGLFNSYGSSMDFGSGSSTLSTSSESEHLALLAEVRALRAATADGNSEILPPPGSGAARGAWYYKDSLYVTHDDAQYTYTALNNCEVGDRLQYTRGSDALLATVSYIDTTNSYIYLSGGEQTVLGVWDINTQWTAGVLVNLSSPGDEPTLTTFHTSDGSKTNYASLYRGTPGEDVSGSWINGGWRAFPLGFEVGFTAGKIEPLGRDHSAAQSSLTTTGEDTGWLSPGVIEQNFASTDTDRLREVNQASAYDDNPASQTVVPTVIGMNLIASKYSANVPEGSVVTGIQVRLVKRTYTHTGETRFVKDQHIGLTVGGGIDIDPALGLSDQPNASTDRALAADWANAASSTEAWTTYAPTVYGSATNIASIWGVAYTRQMVNDDTFSLYCSITGGTGVGAHHPIEMDTMQVKIYYKKKVQLVHIYDSSGTYIAMADLLYAFKESGDWEFGGDFAAVDENGDPDPLPPAGGDAAGTLTLYNLVDTLSASIDPRDIPAGSIVTSTDESSEVSQIGVLDSIPAPVTLPGSSVLEADRTQYQGIRHNFYALERFESYYAACGSAPAISIEYDEVSGTEYLIRIRTGLELGQELPRHVADHQSRLVLGYSGGSLLMSSVVSPEDYEGLNGAIEIAVGDSITGLTPLSGDVLGVFTEQSVHGLYGTTEVKTLSPTSGAIEYTVQNIGTPIYCDFRGIATLDATQKYGDFQRGRLTNKISNWIVRRVQSQLSQDTSLGTIRTSTVSRNKGQYRLYFTDGTILTAAITDNGIEPTVQQYTSLCVQDVQSDIDSSGREWIFATCEVDNNHVFQLDRGYSFDGGNIDAHIILNPVFLENPIQNMTVKRASIHFLAQGTVDPYLYAANDYQDPLTTSPSINSAGDATQALDFLGRHEHIMYPISQFGTNVVFHIEDKNPLGPTYTVQSLIAFVEEGHMER